MKKSHGVLLAVLVLVASLFFQAGCGCNKTPSEEKPASTAEKPTGSKHASSGPKAPAIKFDSLDLPKDLIKDIEGNIKDWVAKKGHTFSRDKAGKVMVKSAKGRKVKVPASVLPTSDRLSKPAAEMIENRLKEWASKKGYTTGLDKKGHFVGKSPKGKNVTPSLDIFLATLPEGLVGGSAPVADDKGSGSEEGSDEGADESGDGSDSEE